MTGQNFNLFRHGSPPLVCLGSLAPREVAKHVAASRSPTSPFRIQIVRKLLQPHNTPHPAPHLSRKCDAQYFLLHLQLLRIAIITKIGRMKLGMVAAECVGPASSIDHSPQTIQKVAPPIPISVDNRTFVVLRVITSLV